MTILAEPGVSTNVAAPSRSSARSMIARATLFRLVALSGLFACVFWPTLRRLWLKDNPFFGEPNWQHGLFVPLIGLYYLVVNRDELAAAPPQPLSPLAVTRGRMLAAVLLAACGASLIFITPLLGRVISLGNFGVPMQVAGASLIVWAVAGALLNWGYASLIMGLLIYAYGIWPGRVDYVADLGMVVTLFGVVLTLCGWRIMSIAWFPVVFLLCALPWPPLFYARIAGPLQELAAQAAVITLRLTGVEAYVSGTTINMGGFGTQARALNVAEACSGLKSLMTFLSLAAAIGFISSRPLWQKLVITLSAVPIAIACNVMRVCGQGLLDHYISQQLSESFAHQFVGLIMLIPAFFLILGVGWVLDRLVVDEVDGPPGGALGRTAGASVPPAGGQVIRRRLGAPPGVTTASAGVNRSLRHPPGAEGA